jgi:peptidyl-prolyl cis-trans isomerase A (cyclophilin A)
MLLASLALLMGVPAAAQTPDVVRVSIVTTAGKIVVELDRAHAPVTTANFLRYVDAKRFDGTAFYRAMNLAENFGLIQGGVRDPKFLYPAIAHEPTSVTGLRHGDGTISMARGAPGTARADFFITLGAMTSLDANPTGPDDNLGFAAFGRVVEGMDVVRTILTGPTSPTEGAGVMRGQMLSPTVKILTARRG